MIGGHSSVESDQLFDRLMIRTNGCWARRIAMGEDERLRDLVAEVAAAYFSNSHVPPFEIPNVVQQIATSLAAVGVSPGAVDQPTEITEPARAKLTGAQIRKSITPDALISFEDGKPYKTRKRHLGTKGLSFAAYQEKWGLPKDYPTVAPNYSAARSAMAKSLGLGNRRRTLAPETTSSAAPKRRGRKPAVVPLGSR